MYKTLDQVVPCNFLTPQLFHTATTFLLIPDTEYIIILYTTCI